jgi:uncharacterized membrane protein
MISSTHLHAIVIHFPIALLIICFLTELVSLFLIKPFFKQMAFYLLLLGTFGTVVSYLSGDAAGEGMEGGSLGRAIELHEEAATIALWLTITTAVLYLLVFIFKYNRKWVRVVSILLFACVVGAIARTGYLGGQLVYKHGAGVELGLPDFSSTDDDSKE